MTLNDDLDPGNSYIGLDSLYFIWRFPVTHPFNWVAQVHDWRYDNQRQGYDYHSSSKEADSEFLENALQTCATPGLILPDKCLAIGQETKKELIMRVQSMIETVRSWRALYYYQAYQDYSIVRAVGLVRWPAGIKPNDSPKR